MNASYWGHFLSGSLSCAQALRRMGRSRGHTARALAVAGAFAIAAAPGAALAATHAVPAGSHYFADFAWSTFSTATPPDPATTTYLAPVTGGWLAGIPFGVSAPNPAYPTSSRYFPAGSYIPGDLPVDTGFPASGATYHNVGKSSSSTGLSFGFTYTFAQAIPRGTHVFIQDLDGYEEATLTFKACGSGAVVNPSGWDDLKLSADPATDHITTTFGATDIQLVSYVAGGWGRDEPTVAIVVRNAGVCQIELGGNVPTGSYGIYFAVPPTDPSTVAPVPTLSEWMLLGLGLLMAGLVWVRVRAAAHRV